MTHNNPTSNGQPGRQGATRGKRIRVEATRRERVDPDMIALCYWLIAQRIVQEAGDESDSEQSSAQSTGSDDQGTDVAVKGTRS